MLAWAFSWRLDAALAEGADPLSDPLLVVRAEHLRSRHHRRQLARGLLDLIERVERRPGRGSTAPIARPSVLANASLLRELADWIDSERPAAARGLAAANLLLTDGASPLWVRSDARELRDALEAALIGLGS